MTKATFTSTKEARSAGATFTPPPTAEPFGWQGRKYALMARHGMEPG